MTKITHTILLAGAALTGLTVAGAVHAADIPPYRAPPPIEYYNWSGFYSGGFVGAAWGRTNWGNATITDPDFLFLGPPPPPFPFASGLNFSPRLGGIIAGTQSGFNYQFGGWVIGAEVDFGYGNAVGSRDCSPATLGAGFFFPVTCSSHMSWVGTAAARLGVAVWERLLVYGKAGGAYAKFDYDETSTQTAAVVAGQVVATAGERRGGWLVGAGFEFGFTQNWSGKVEYNYMDFGSRRVTFTNGDFADIGINVQTVKIGLNYRWGGYGPLHARY